ncbi:MAG: adenylate kinase [Planctomycetota bacterium]
MRLVFLGPPGAGKGTQAKLLADAHGLLHLSTGDMLRSAVARGTPTGRKAKGYMDRGQLVPDEIVDVLVAERLGDEDAQGGRFILDGYPRNVGQAAALARALAAGGATLDAVLFLDVDDEILVGRLRGRRDSRADDTDAVIRERLTVYRAHTEPLVAHYEAEGLLCRIDGDRSIEAVREAVAAALEGIRA